MTPPRSSFESADRARDLTEEETRPDWSRSCEVCGQTPVLPITGMCGPCGFGEAETAGGNW